MNAIITFVCAAIYPQNQPSPQCDDRPTSQWLGESQSQQFCSRPSTWPSNLLHNLQRFSTLKNCTEQTIVAYIIHLKVRSVLHCLKLSHLISFSLIVWCCSWSCLIVLSYVNLQHLTPCDFVLFHLKGSCQSLHHRSPNGTWWPQNLEHSIRVNKEYYRIYHHLHLRGDGAGVPPFMEYLWGWRGILTCSPGTYKIDVLQLIVHHAFCFLFFRLHVPPHPHPSSPTPSSSSCLQGPCYGI